MDPGHFHLTVGTASALTFMGLTYWMLPRLVGTELKFGAWARVQPSLWFAGMCFFSISNRITGLMECRGASTRRATREPRRRSSGPWTAMSAARGFILFVSAMAFVLVVVGTLPWGKPLTQPVKVVLAESIDPVENGSVWDRLGLSKGFVVF